MADQLGVHNVKQQLIGTKAPASRNAAVYKENVVVNASEKRYLWTARAFAVVTAISICCNLVLIVGFWWRI